MFKLEGNARAALMGILFAMVGFSYALATSAGVSDASASASSRAVIGGTSLHFTNPRVAGNSGDYDLGDAVAGSLFTTRYCRAVGGVPPYSFTSPAAATNPLSKVRPELTLFTNGALFVGTGGALSTAAGPIKFAVQVTDSLSGSANVANGQFRITLVSTNLFKFGISSLGNGATGHSYTDSLIVLNGATTTTKGITFTADTISGASGTTTLEANGFFLASNGAISGKPAAVGIVSFVAHATDANGNKALSRDGSREGQPLTITVESAGLTSDITSTSITIKAGNGTGKNGVGKDGITYKGFVNIGAITTSGSSGFAGKTITLKIGNYTSPAVVFDSKGNAATAKGVTPAVKASIKKAGVLGITVSKESLGLISISASGLQSVSVSIADANSALVSNEILPFTSKTGRGTAFTLTYKGGGGPGGNFQLLKVLGADDKAGTGDAWKVSFVASPATGAPTGTASSATISVGTFTAPALTLSSKGTKIAGKGSSKTPGTIAAFSLDSKKGAGSFTTSVLPGQTATAINTGIKQASTATGAATFSADILLGSTDLVDSIQVIANKKKWASQ